MKIKDYINKNLPNLNWNILPQIFEDEGVELTEEIKAYLKETPGNTNWNLLKFKNDGSSRTLIFNDKITTTAVGWTNTHDPIELDFSLDDIPVIITVDGTEYTLPYTGEAQGGTQHKWGDWNSEYSPNFDNYPIAFRTVPYNSFQILTQSTGTYNIKIEIEN